VHRPPGWGANRPGYSRPPRVWKGRRYYTYHRYYNHPYRPYAWGPAWHPVGFFLSAIATSAVIVAYNDIDYRYDAGVYYQPADGGYKVVPPPIGAVVPVLPQDAVSLAVDGDTYYYYGGVFYIKIDNGYQTVRAPAGAIVYNLPDGCTTINADGVTYLQYNGDFYQPIEDSSGQPAYEVVEIEDGGD
jgi:hypothetical protein